MQPYVIAQVRQFTDWLHEEWLTAKQAADEAERIDAANGYSRYEETIERLETRGAEHAVRRIWDEWQKLRAEVPEFYEDEVPNV